MICHTETAWQPATFDHNQTNFPLTGQHAVIECADCHTDNQFTALTTDCYACHQTDFEGVTDPNHVANNFDHNCMTCHTTEGWSPASFDHNNTEFPLTGAHVPLECIACHSQGYVNTPTDCYACHQTDYQNTTDPNHQAAGFPTDCMQCHNTSNWDNANWDHDGQYFPIYSGKHKDEWDACMDCHVNSSNFMVFECIFCHEHNQSDTDKDHSEVAGYVYESNACYTCHPNGNSDIMLNRMGQ